jgi:hypothetical protein
LILHQDGILVGAYSQVVLSGTLCDHDLNTPGLGYVDVESISTVADDFLWKTLTSLYFPCPLMTSQPAD